MGRAFFIFLLGLFIVCMQIEDAAASKRVALIIGNTTYDNVPTLKNPSSDAQAIAGALKRLGFSNVLLRLNQNYSGLRRTLAQFAREAAGADVALIYYAGHGIEVGDTNYLIPTDATLLDSGDVDFEAIPLSMVMGALDRVKKLKIVVLDACRENPFRANMMSSTGATRSIGRGLARVAPRGNNTLIAYAAKEGTVARDGDGKNSPYTAAFLKHVETPGLEIGFFFRKVRDSVLDATGGHQVPFVYGSLSGEAIYLKEPGSQPAPRPALRPDTTPALSPMMSAAAFAWGQVENSENVEDIKAFLRLYGKHSAEHAKKARRRIAQLERKMAALPPPARDTSKMFAPAPDLSKLSSKCRSDLNAWRRKASFGAYAMASEGGCGWSWGYKTLDEAKQSAMRFCKKYGTGCQVVEVHTNQRGDWSISDNCNTDLKAWRKKASIGAFAVERGGGCGWSWGNKTIAEARKNALSFCSKQGPECRVIATHTDQKGDWSLSDACRKDLAGWRKKPSTGSFAVERGGACGWSWGYKTHKEAQNRAITECLKWGKECKVIKTK